MIDRRSTLKNAALLVALAGREKIIIVTHLLNPPGAMDSCHKHPEIWKPFGGQSPPEDFKVPDSWKPGRVWDPETSTFKDVITQ